MHTSYETILLQRFSRNETLLNFEGYKDTISNKYTERMVSSHIGHSHTTCTPHMNHFTAAFLRYGTLIHFEDYKDTISNKYNK